MILDRIMFATHSSVIREKLLNEGVGLKFKAVETARSFEYMKLQNARNINRAN